MESDNIPIVMQFDNHTVQLKSAPDVVPDEARIMDILFVDDETPLLEVAKLFLEREGDFNVDVVESAVLALEVLKSKEYDAIVSDCMMPEMDGIEFLKSLRRSGDRTPFIFFTAKGGEERAIEALNSGADYYLGKDGDPRSQFAELASIIRKCVDRRRADTTLREGGEKYRELFDSMKSGVAVYEGRDDGECFVFKDINRAVERIECMDKRQVLGRSVSDVFPDVKRFGLFDALQRVWRTGIPENLPTSYYKDGRMAGWRENYVYKMPSGEVVAVYEDVTDKVTTEKTKQAVFNISEATSSATDIQDLYKRLHSILEDLMPIRNVFIALYDPSADTISFPYFVDEHDPPPAPRRAGRGATEYVLRTGRPLLAFNQDFQELSEKGEIEIIGSIPVCWIGVPLQIEGRTIGLLAVQSYDENIRYSEREMDILSFVTDQIAITIERKNSERALRKSEEKYRNFVEKANDGIAIIQDELIKYMNPKLVDMIGHSVEDTIGRRFTDLIWPEEVSKLLDYHRKRLRGEKVPTVYEASMRSKDDRRVRVEFNVSVMEYEGKPAYFVIVRDLTDRIEAQEALRLSEQRYRTIFDTTGTAMITVDEDATILHANGEFERMSGYSKEEIEGKMKWTEFPSESDLQRMIGYHVLRRIDPKAAPNRFEFKFISRDLKTYDILATVDMIRGTRLSVASYMDVTDLHEVQEALGRKIDEQRDLLNNIETMVWYAVDPETYGKVNTARAAFLGKEEQDIEGKKIWEFLPPDEAKVAIAGNRQVFDTKTTYHGLERLTNGKGEMRLVSVTKAPKLDEKGNVEFAVCSANDVTDLKEAQEALALANRKLNLLGSVTRHDILNQLTVITGGLGMAEGIVKEERARKLMDMALNASGSIEKYLGFSRDYERMGTAKPEWIDAKEACMKGMSTLETGDVDLVVDLDGLEIYADKLLEKVFHNLIGNALKHGGKVSTVHMYSRREDGHMVLVCEDDGNGIPKDKKKSILEGRYGRGLYLVKEILGITGMTIIETGEEGRGARFEISVPEGNYRPKDR